MVQFILGGLAGIVIMCLLQISREKDRNVELQMLKMEEQGLVHANKSYREIINKQNKIINNMSISMENNHCGIENIVDETICDHRRCIGNAIQCRDCIKEYFERKVK